MNSLFFGDVQVGMQFRSAMSAPFTLEMCEAHAALTGDRVHKPVPVKGQPGIMRVVVQGNLITARTGGLLFEVGHFNETLLAQAEKHIVYKSPTYVGDSIYAIEEVVKVDEQEGRSTGIVVLKRTTFNQDDQVVQLVPFQDYRVLKRK
jgi:acyl dehydratase